MSVSRRRFLRASAALVGGAGLTGIVSKEAAAKIKPSLVGYQETPKDGHDCKGCKLFEPPSSCKSVEGVISPNGWCKLWIKA